MSARHLTWATVAGRSETSYPFRPRHCWLRRTHRPPPTAPPLQVMTVVKSLATHGITVCATIHSPTPYCFNLFDRMLLLLRGQVAYFGPNGGLTAGFAAPQIRG